jgi:Domain of unknown function (DUF6602)
MANQLVLNRLNGIQSMLKAVHQSNSGLSDATSGAERAAFVDGFLASVLPAPFRFGTGDATDQNGGHSGQLDVVVENAFCPSLPIVGTGHVRLYLAEAVAAVIEVKSNAEKQWRQVLKTAAKLEPLRRKFRASSYVGRRPSDRIPFFVVGYEGWKQQDSLKAKLAEGAIDGILVIDPGLFVSSSSFGDRLSSGEAALWGLISCLHEATNSLKQNTPEPYEYVI